MKTGVTVNTMSPQNAQSALSEMTETDAYMAGIKKPILNPAYFDFWHAVNRTTGLCLTLIQNEALFEAIRASFDRLHNMTVGELAQFRPFIERARAKLI
jgi:hypothetical protein